MCLKQVIPEHLFASLYISDITCITVWQCAMHLSQTPLNTFRITVTFLNSISIARCSRHSLKCDHEPSCLFFYNFVIILRTQVLRESISAVVTTISHFQMETRASATNFTGQPRATVSLLLPRFVFGCVIWLPVQSRKCRRSIVEFRGAEMPNACGIVELRETSCREIGESRKFLRKSRRVLVQREKPRFADRVSRMFKTWRVVTIPDGEEVRFLDTGRTIHGGRSEIQ